MRIRKLAARGITVAILTIGIVAAGGASIAAAKSCKGEDRWKCAPKRYHLSATDSVGPGPQSSGFVENWTAEVDLVRLRRNFARVIYGAEDGTVKVSGSRSTTCPDGSSATIRIEPQTIPVPRGPGYPFLGDFGVEFTLVKTSLFKKNTYGGPLGTQGSGHSNLFATAIDPCPGGQGSFLTELTTPLEGMDGRGKVGKVVKGEGVDSGLFQHHSFTWELTPKK